VEINPRLIGGVVPDLISAAYGRRILVDVVRLHLGEGFTPLGTPLGVGTIRAFYSEVKGQITAIQPSGRATDPRVLRYLIRSKVGDRATTLTDNNDRLGFVVVFEKTLESSRQLAADLFKETQFVIQAAT
jgi:hypothetical protein